MSTAFMHRYSGWKSIYGDYRKTEAASEQIHHEGRSLEQIASQKKEELSAVHSECTKLQQNLDSCQQEAQRLEFEKQEMEKQKKISIPKTRYIIIFFKHYTI
jgi:septal ring factor EnvC (AmiA/AmiB activator)